MAYVRTLVLFTVPCVFVVAAACGSHEGEDRRAMQEEAKSTADRAAKAKHDAEDGESSSDATAGRGRGTERALDRLLRHGGNSTRTPETNGEQRNKISLGRNTVATAGGTGACSLPLSIASDVSEGRTRTLLTGRFAADCGDGGSVRVSLKATGPVRFVTPMSCEAEGADHEVVCSAPVDDVLDANGDVAIEVEASPEALRGLHVTLTFE